MNKDRAKGSISSIQFLNQISILINLELQFSVYVDGLSNHDCYDGE